MKTLAIFLGLVVGTFSLKANAYVPNAKLAGESVSVRVLKDEARVTAVFEFEELAQDVRSGHWTERTNFPNRRGDCPMSRPDVFGSILFVRKKAKEYGTCRFAEGGEVTGRRLLIVEDVVTSGGQIIESVRALRGEGAIISDVVCVIDRQAGGRENLEKEGLALVSLFLKSELL